MRNIKTARRPGALLLLLLIILLLPLFSGCGKNGDARPAAEPEPSENGNGVYTIRLSEEVAGFAFTFCTGDVCVPVTTTADGTAVFEGPAAEYEVKLIRSAEGYEADFPEERVIGPASGEILVEVSETAS